MSSAGKPNAEEIVRTDVVVIGAGGSGLAAAAAAAEKGASVVLLEKRNVVGGNSAMAEAFFAAESPAQQRMLTDAPRDVLFKMAMDYSHWNIDPRIVRAFIDKSGDTVRWLEAKGLEIYWVSPYYPNQVIRTEHQARKGGADVVKVLVSTCEALGCKILCRTSARKIFKSAAGAVSGVLALNGEKEIKIDAGSAVIATGGYAANKELLKKYCPSYTEDLLYNGLPHTGDGLIMAMEAGAANEGLGMLQMFGPRHEKFAHRKVGVMCEQPYTMWVNKKGERFVDEATIFKPFESANAVARQPGKVSYILFDEQVLQDTVNKGPVNVRQGVLYGPKRTDLANLPAELQAEVEKGTVKMSGCWDEIAEWIGAPPEAFAATVEEYNRFCDSGHDRTFAKDRRYLVPLRTPPYYGMKGRVGIIATIGGIKINERMEVLDDSDNSIPGLYAVGNDAGGWQPDTYNVNLSGSAFGFALNSGRIAGENAAAYSQRQ
jgi:fumarate reductase flavoprotein subunit